MTVTPFTIADPAEANAIGLCWMARQDGLPDIHSLRRAVATLHRTECGWCAYPPAMLLRALEDYRETLRDEAEHELRRADKRYWEIPGAARLRLLEIASGRQEAVRLPKMPLPTFRDLHIGRTDQ